jgi:hypothetical protein
MLNQTLNKWRQPDPVSARASLQLARCAGRYVPCKEVVWHFLI